MTQNRVKDAWFEVGDELEAIALKLKLHLEQESSEGDHDAEGAFERRDVNDVLRGDPRRQTAAVEPNQYGVADVIV